ncbi:MAG: hypothetical protein CMC05_02660 [Flavobacteriaceae bacterium]|nr:hypothetical protein [Flavobacteriaceae bacterium]MBD10577.1 hypothetical protein [Flavobacteriaceae bacterium]|tara:strand:- start:325 stop:786 length:462 start_codon:yes stop_codon:yes gene_type:complete
MANLKTKKEEAEPNIIKWAFKFAASAGIAGILCCVAPAVLFMFGLMGGVYAISFADFFYAEDGSIGLGSWILRGVAVVIGLYGIYMYRKKQNQCSIDPKRKKKNLILVILTIIVLGVGIFLSLEKWSSWYFDKHIVPAQQEEYRQQKLDNNKN